MEKEADTVSQGMRCGSKQRSAAATVSRRRFAVTWGRKPKKRRSRQGKDPKTLKENRPKSRENPASENAQDNRGQTEGMRGDRN